MQFAVQRDHVGWACSEVVRDGLLRFDDAKRNGALCSCTSELMSCILEAGSGHVIATVMKSNLTESADLMIRVRFACNPSMSARSKKDKSDLSLRESYQLPACVGSD
jgi:hypothetical protein